MKRNGGRLGDQSSFAEFPAVFTFLRMMKIPVPMKDIRARYSKQTFEVKSLHCLVLTTCLFLPSSRSLRLPSPAIAKSTTEARFAHETQLPMPLSSCSFYCSTSSRNGAPFALRSLMTGHCYDHSLFSCAVYINPLQLRYEYCWPIGGGSVEDGKRRWFYAACRNSVVRGSSRE